MCAILRQPIPCTQCPSSPAQAGFLALQAAITARSSALSIRGSSTGACFELSPMAGLGRSTAGSHFNEWKAIAGLVSVYKSFHCCSFQRGKGPLGVLQENGELIPRHHSTGHGCELRDFVHLLGLHHLLLLMEGCKPCAACRIYARCST